jgi:uncharacterized paraquat-inducible protein A
MYRGMTLFKCHECDKVFKAPDIEYNATVFSEPQPCPRCGSYDTYPLGSSRPIYAIRKGRRKE